MVIKGKTEDEVNAELQEDIESLSTRADDIRDATPSKIVCGYADRRVAHADPRRLQDEHPTFGHVRECIDQLWRTDMREQVTRI